MKQSACVYTVYGADNEAIYVGCTHDVEQRLKTHRAAGTPWFSLMKSYSFTSPLLRKDALALERKEIRRLRPKFNINGTIRGVMGTGPSKQWLEQREALTKRNETIRRLRRRGWTLERIGQRYGIARQRVWKILNP